MVTAVCVEPVHEVGDRWGLGGLLTRHDVPVGGARM
jgi:hypothetical protein